MSKSVADVMQLVKDEDVKFVDFRFTDTRGKEQHVSVPVSAFDEDKFESGHAFDGSSIAGWKGIEASDMLLIPDADTAFIDPFYEESTLVMSCDVVEPADGKGYERDPRSLAKRAEAYLKSSGLGDAAFFRARRAVISRLLRSTHSRTSVRKCACCSSKSVFRLKCTTTKWRARARTKSARSSRRWFNAPTGRNSSSTSSIT
jgi:hypothetical protein